MTISEKAYVEGFMGKCAEYGVDPEALVKAAGMFGTSAADLNEGVGRAALGGAARGAATMTAIGAGLGAIRGGMNGTAMARIARNGGVLKGNKAMRIAGMLGYFLKPMLGQAARGAVQSLPVAAPLGAGIGGLNGALNQAASNITKRR